MYITFFLLSTFFLMFPYFPSNPLKGLIITKFFVIGKFFPLFLLFIISFTSWNLKLEQPRIHLKKVQSQKCLKVVAQHSHENLQIQRAARILPHLYHNLFAIYKNRFPVLQAFVQSTFTKPFLSQGYSEIVLNTNKYSCLVNATV